MGVVFCPCPLTQALKPARSPAAPSLTLQLLVPGLPLQADGGRPLVDEALKAGVLALLHGAAGWVDGDDGALET